LRLATARVSDPLTSKSRSSSNGMNPAMQSPCYQGDLSSPAVLSSLHFLSFIFFPITAAKTSHSLPRMPHCPHAPASSPFSSLSSSLHVAAAWPLHRGFDTGIFPEAHWPKGGRCVALLSATPALLVLLLSVIPRAYFPRGTLIRRFHSCVLLGLTC
jgi:hypothetical protein